MHGPGVLVKEKAAEVHEGSDAILLPSIEKCVEIALRTDEERAELPKKHKVVVDFQLPIANPGAPGSQIET